MDTSSNTFLHNLGRFIAIILSTLFVLTALASLIVFNIERRAFNAGTYKQALVDDNFYQKFPTLLGDLLQKNLGKNAPVFAQQLTADDWKGLVQALLPPAQLQAMTEDALNQLFAYLNEEGGTPHISLVSFKQSLSGQAGFDAAMTIIQRQPVCTLTQIGRILTTFGQEICNPPPEILNLLHPLIQTNLQAIASAIPDQVSIIKDSDPVAAQSRLQGLRNLRLLMRLSPLFPLLLLLGITVLAVRTFRDWLAWWGWPFLITGLLGMLIGFSGAPLVRGSLEKTISQRVSVSMPQEVGEAIRSVVDATLREILKPAGWESLFLFLAGSAMILLA
ncbi:MAG TPA: hypothetical protein VHM28_03470, partial [Anaerolineales bacterium]|nr:hypothetical protein [Anaerolineales bacterium]